MLADVGRRELRADLRVDHALDRLELLRGDRLRVREIEAQAIGRDQRAFLDHVRAEDLAQRRVQQVRRGMIEHRRLARGGIDLRRDDVALAQAAGFDRADVQVRVAELLRVA